MKRRGFLQLAAMAPVMAAVKPKKLHRVVVMVVRNQLPDGTWVKAWASVPDGQDLSDKDAKKKGYEVLYFYK